MTHLFDRWVGRGRDRRAEASSWWLIDPPPLAPHHLADDLYQRWREEFANAPLPRRLAFSVLRIIQHLAYRWGYGGDRVRAKVPRIRSPDMETMGENLADLPPALRQRWLLGFLSALNTPGPEPEPPRSVVFELANTCNFACEHCGVGASDAGERWMDPRRLKVWAGQICSKTDLVRINGLGEATLHPRLGECVEILAEYPGSREIITNLSAPMETYRMLLAAGYVILGSWDAATESTFERIRRGACFEDLRTKVPKLVDAAGAAGAPDPVLLFTVRPENVGEVAATVSLAADMGVRRLTVNVLRLATGEDWTARCFRELLAAFEAASETADRRGVMLALPDHLGSEPLGLPMSMRSAGAGCQFPWTQVVVRWDGRLTSCNMMNPYSFGHLESRDFTESWGGALARCFRSVANTADRHPYCAGCYFLHAEGDAQS